MFGPFIARYKFIYDFSFSYMRMSVHMDVYLSPTKLQMSWNSGLTTPFHIVPSSRQHAVIPPFAHSSSQHDAKVCKGATFPCLYHKPIRQFNANGDHSVLIMEQYKNLYGDHGGTVVKVLCYKSEGCWFDSRWCHWNFLLT